MGILKRLRSRSKGHQEAEELIEVVQWNELTSDDLLEKLHLASKERPQLIFKHSNRCGISSMVLRRFIEQPHEVIDGIDFHMIDVIGSRSISNTVSEQYGVVHQSPQIVLIKDGVCALNDSHYEITNRDLTSFV